MKIHILNDLHLEFDEFSPPETDADVVVLAGDIHVGLAALPWVATHFPKQQIVYVPGNHEFYNHDITLHEQLKIQAPNQCHVLNNDSVFINGTRFLGSTLWTDFALFGETEKINSMQYAGLCMNDFRAIRYNGHRFRPESAATLHAESRRWLVSQLEQSFAGKTVIVTHHVPSPLSISPKYTNNPLNPAFVSNLESLMDDQISLWVHGHTHESFDYTVNGTRVVCNPRGYVSYELNESFNPSLVVEI